MTFYSRDELSALGLGRFGQNVRISRKASLHNPAGIYVGNDVRIDDFCVLSAGPGGIEIGDYVHLAVFCSLIGAEKITLADFSGLSSRVSVYSSNDDYSGAHLTNPTIPACFTKVTHAAVMIGRHCVVGSGAVVLPGVILEEGVAIGALTLVTKNCPAFGIYSGIPARRIRERKRQLLDLEKQLRSEASSTKSR